MNPPLAQPLVPNHAEDWFANGRGQGEFDLVVVASLKYIAASPTPPRAHLSQQKMMAEGLDPGLLDSGGDVAAAPPGRNSTAPGDPRVAKYLKMLSMHLPRGAVEQKMVRDWDLLVLKANRTVESLPGSQHRSAPTGWIQVCSTAPGLKASAEEEAGQAGEVGQAAVEAERVCLKIQG